MGAVNRCFYYILVLEAGFGAGRDTDVRELAFPVSNDLGDS